MPFGFSVVSIQKLNEPYSSHARIHSLCSHLGHFQLFSLLCDSNLANWTPRLVPCSEIFHHQISPCQRRGCAENYTGTQFQACSPQACPTFSPQVIAEGQVLLGVLAGGGLLDGNTSTCPGIWSISPELSHHRGRWWGQGLAPLLWLLLLLLLL